MSLLVLAHRVTFGVQCLGDQPFLCRLKSAALLSLWKEKLTLTVMVQAMANGLPPPAALWPALPSPGSEHLGKEVERGADERDEEAACGPAIPASLGKERDHVCARWVS